MTVDEIYLQIAHDISDAIDAEWSIARVTCELEEDAGRLECAYTDASGSAAEHGFELGYQTYKAFVELQQIATEDGEHKWVRANFTLHSTGEFNIDIDFE